MLIDINKVIVNDRIRKDFGDIQELANDIQENGLINPPVVNTNYELLAGERRLRACKLLGWPQIEVRMMDTRDAEHELNIEISENDVRKGFTKTERIDYIKRLLRIEQAKAAERKKAGVANLSENSHEGRSDEATAQQFGISSNTMRRELFIADNADMLDPSDFADWDEGKLSTNKAFQRIKSAKARAELERDQARNDLQDAYLANENMDAQLASYQKQMNEALSEIASLEKQNDELYAQKNPEPKVVEREVVREVLPDHIQRRLKSLEHLERIHSDDNQKLRRHIEELRKELDRAKGILRMDKGTKDVQRDVEYLISSTNQYVRQYGGLTWTFERIADVDDVTREELRKAVTNLATFSNALVASLEQMQ